MTKKKTKKAVKVTGLDINKVANGFILIEETDDWDACNNKYLFLNTTESKAELLATITKFINSK